MDFLNFTGLTEINENISNKELKEYKFPAGIKSIIIKTNFRKCEWLLFGGYQPTSHEIYFFLDCISKGEIAIANRMAKLYS